MRDVVDDQGVVIGKFDGNVIENENGEVLYWISGGDVFSPDKDTQYLNVAIGEFDGKHGTIHGELIFTVK